MGSAGRHQSPVQVQGPSAGVCGATPVTSGAGDRLMESVVAAPVTSGAGDRLMSLWWRHQSPVVQGTV